MHIPVLLGEVIEYLNPQSNQNFIDCTFGAGGHARAILEKIKPGGKLLAIDANPQAKTGIMNYELGIRERIVLINDNFRNLKNIYEQNFPYSVNGVLLDLGFSSIELDGSGLGFSFQRNEPLDMRFNPEEQRLTAREILNKYSLKKLVEIFCEFGEVSRASAKKVALAIIKQRGRKQFETTFDLVDIFKGRGRGRIHPATLFFQALRIEVNDELNAIREVLPQAIEILEPDGKLAVISFHSLEDRIVKHYFKGMAKEGMIEILTKKPVVPSADEVKDNPRARSGKMRVVEKK